MSVDLHLADCREVMRSLPENSVDAIVTDPPYGLTTGLDPFAMVRSWLADEMNRECWTKLAALGWTEDAARSFADDLHPREEYEHGGVGFMNSAWDSIVPGPSYWREALRVLKPGGYVLAFGATRTWHWLACALELCGFESRGSIAWIQGQGMQHGLDISKAMDADAGAEREVVGEHPYAARKPNGTWTGDVYGAEPGHGEGPKLTAPATDEAKRWAGWGTQLAPKHEPICMFRKPLEGTYVENIRAHGAGGLNVDACRLAGGKQVPTSGSDAMKRRGWGYGGSMETPGCDPNLGRWPPNVVIDEAAAAQLDAMVGKRTSGTLKAGTRVAAEHGRARGKADGYTKAHSFGGDTGGPSRFFFCPKAPTGERDKGCEHLRWVRDGSGWRACEAGEKPDLVGNSHSTVKPLELMRWLVRLVTPLGGLVFDPFLGSGTTGVAAVCEGMRFVGSDMTPWAYKIADARIRWAQGRGPSLAEIDPAGKVLQGSLFT